MSKLASLTAVVSLLSAAIPAQLCAEQVQQPTVRSQAEVSPAAASSAKKKKPSIKPAGNANCPVGGSPVGSMQAGSHIIHKGYKVGLCCDGCKGRFMQDPDAYLQKALSEKKN